MVEDLLVIGAGPHALAFLCTLKEKLPMASNLVDAKGGVTRSRLGARSMRRRLEDRVKKPQEFPEGLEHVKVLDAFGSWLVNWKWQFSFLNIPHLRSTGGVHPDPVDPEILFEFARWRGLSTEEGFTEITGVPRNKFFRGPFQTPKTQLFQEFCEYLIKAYDLQNVVRKGDAVDIEAVDQDGCVGKLFKVGLKEGDCIMAKRVVVSIGHTNQKLMPHWVDYDVHPRDRIVHAWDLVHLNLESGKLKDQQVLIVGGGLTSVQLVHAAHRLDAAHVVLMVRSEVKVKQFDSNLLWSGRLRHEKLSSFWAEESMEKRLELISEARQGGSIPVDAEEELQLLQDTGICSVQEYTEVWEAEWLKDKGAFKLLLSDGSFMEANTIWLATGSSVDVSDEPLFSKLMHTHPVDAFSGYPGLTEDLRWAHGWDLFVVGAYAALTLGPDATNLSGARRAAFKVTQSLKNQSD